MLSMNYESGSESEAEVYQGYVTLQPVKKGLKISANVHSLRDGSVALATSIASTICIARTGNQIQTKFESSLGYLI